MGPSKRALFRARVQVFSLSALLGALRASSRRFCFPVSATIPEGSIAASQWDAPASPAPSNSSPGQAGEISVNYLSLSVPRRGRPSWKLRHPCRAGARRSGDGVRCLERSHRQHAGTSRGNSRSHVARTPHPVEFAVAVTTRRASEPVHVRVALEFCSPDRLELGAP